MGNVCVRSCRTYDQRSTERASEGRFLPHLRQDDDPDAHSHHQAAESVTAGHARGWQRGPRRTQPQRSHSAATGDRQRSGPWCTPDVTANAIVRQARRTAERLHRSVAADIGRLRSDAGVTRVALARGSGVDPGYLCRIEQGSERPSLETYAQLAAALGADLSVGSTRIPVRRFEIDTRRRSSKPCSPCCTHGGTRSPRSRCGARQEDGSTSGSTNRGAARWLLPRSSPSFAGSNS